jgi:type II secretory pathway component PulF
MKSSTSPQRILGLFAKLQNIQIGPPRKLVIRQNDLLRIFQSLSTLVSNGVSLVSALETIQSDETFRRHLGIIRSLTQSVKSGSSLSFGMKKFPQTFPTLMVQQVEIGEATGALGDMLNRIVGQLENRSELKKFLLKKLTYPCVLLTAGFGCVLFMLTKVIPTFQGMYKESGATLPWITQFLVDLSHICINYGPVIVVVAVLALGSGATAYMNMRTGRFIDRALLSMPLFGTWFRNVAILQFTESLGNLLESGFQLAEALPIAARSVGNRFASNELLTLHSAIRRGEKFSTAMQEQKKLFPPVMMQLVIVGEKSGKISSVTRQIHLHMKGEVEKHTAAMLATIEPLLTAFLAAVIGGILLAVYLPMFDMLSHRSN